MPKGNYLTKPQFGTNWENPTEVAAAAWLEQHCGETGEAVTRSLADLIRFEIKQERERDHGRDAPRCPQCGDRATHQTPDGTWWDGNAHYWRDAP